MRLSLFAAAITCGRCLLGKPRYGLEETRSGRRVREVLLGIRIIRFPAKLVQSDGRSPVWSRLAVAEEIDTSGFRCFQYASSIKQPLPQGIGDQGRTADHDSDPLLGICGCELCGVSRVTSRANIIFLRSIRFPSRRRQSPLVTFQALFSDIHRRPTVSIAFTAAYSALT